VQKIFFDRREIQRRVDAANRKRLSKFGAFVRQTARKSIRTRKGKSKPGNPPFSHTGVLKRFLFFGYDANRRSVVIGPVFVSGKSGKAPRIIEHGGTVTLPTGTANIQPRPFMQPAFEKELPRARDMWRDSVR